MLYLRATRSMPLASGSRTRTTKRKRSVAPASQSEATKGGPAYSSNPTNQEEACRLITTRINNQDHWVHQSPFLILEELKGLVTLDGQVIAIEWGVFSSLFNHEYKAAIERIAAEAASMMGQKEVRICGNLRKASFEGKKVVFFEKHVTVWFPNLETGGRRAHVYLGPNDLGREWKELGVWRREGKPAVVLC